MEAKHLRLALVLGLASAVSPFAIDMYLPALPKVTSDLQTSTGATQATLIAYFLAFGLAQMIYGPWADSVGRKKPLYFGLTIFAIASIGCAFAPTIESLIILRALQGLGGATLMVIPRAIIRDVLTGPAATRLMAMIMLVISVSPMLAPLAGSGVLAIADWRTIFIILAAAAMASFVMLYFMLPETLAIEKRTPVNMNSITAGCAALLKDSHFLIYTLVGAFGISSFFIFLSSAPFVYTEQFGLTETQFSLAFAVNAIGFFAATQSSAFLGERYGMVNTVRYGLYGFAFFALLLLVCVLAGYETLTLIIIIMFMANACLGVVIPSTMIMALDPHGKIAGLASSLGGTMQMVAGGLLIIILSPFADGTALPMVAGFTFCALGTLALTFFMPRGRGNRTGQESG